MKKSKQDEIETLLYFMPSAYDNVVISELDIKKYFEWSEKGEHKVDVRLSGALDGFNALVSAKQWRGRHVHELYEPGVLEGSVPYFTLLGGFDGPKRKWWQLWKPKWAHKPTPRSVVNFLKKEMFKGIDSKIIEDCYQSIIKKAQPRKEL